MDTIEVNRAPVLTLWAAVVAEELGFDTAEALTLGKAAAEFETVNTPEGIRAIDKNQNPSCREERPAGQQRGS